MALDWLGRAANRLLYRDSDTLLAVFGDNSALRSESASSAAAVILAEDTDDGTNTVTITPGTLSANRTLTAPDKTGTLAVTSDISTDYIAGAGTVVDNSVPVFVGTGGLTVEDTPVTIDPANGDVGGVRALTATGEVTVGVGTLLAPASASTAGYVQLAEDTDNGTHYTQIKGAASQAANRTQTCVDGDGTVPLFDSLPAADNRLLRSHNTSGAQQGSAASLDDSGNLSGLGTLGTSGTATIGGDADVTGAVSFGGALKTGAVTLIDDTDLPYTVLATDHVIVYTDVSPGYGIYLPASVGLGRKIEIINIGGYPITVWPDGTDTINTMASVDVWPVGYGKEYTTYAKLIDANVANYSPFQFDWILEEDNGPGGSGIANHFNAVLHCFDTAAAGRLPYNLNSSPYPSVNFSDAAYLSGISYEHLTILGRIYCDQFVDCQITCADAAGTNNAAFSVQVDKWDGSAVTAARDILILVNATEYLPGGILAVPTSTVTFNTATTGTIVASGAGWLHLRTSATGVFACTCTNSANNTQYFTAHTVGKCPSANWCYPITTGDSATWS